YTFQFSGQQRPAAPQQILQAFSKDVNVPLLDLLPAMEEYCASHQCVPADLFLDANHLSPQGGQAVAELILGFLDNSLPPGTLPGPGNTPTSSPVER
ncbi:MAG: hypothetical protein QGH11_12670, partial [Pirellulaceae bacterium]|nr:hypothetical protein [Pirellulaceae bacterium]